MNGKNPKRKTIAIVKKNRVYRFACAKIIRRFGIANSLNKYFSKKIVLENFLD